MACEGQLRQDISKQTSFYLVEKKLILRKRDKFLNCRGQFNPLLAASHAFTTNLPMKSIGEKSVVINCIKFHNQCFFWAIFGNLPLNVNA